MIHETIAQVLRNTSPTCNNIIWVSSGYIQNIGFGYMPEYFPIILLQSFTLFPFLNTRKLHRFENARYTCELNIYLNDWYLLDPFRWGKRKKRSLADFNPQSLLLKGFKQLLPYLTYMKGPLKWAASMNSDFYTTVTPHLVIAWYFVARHDNQVSYSEKSLFSFVSDNVMTLKAVFILNFKAELLSPYTFSIETELCVISKPNFSFQRYSVACRANTPLEIPLQTITELYSFPEYWGYANSVPLNETGKVNHKYVRSRRLTRLIASKRNSHVIRERSEYHNILIASELIYLSNKTLVLSPGRSIDVNYYIEPSITNTEYLTNKYDILVTSLGGYYGLTCYTIPRYSFAMYKAPFTPNLWASIFITGISLSGFLVIYQRTKNIQTPAFSIFFTFSVLVEEGFVIPRNLEKLIVFRTAIAFWLITAGLLSMCYSSLIITELNSPIKGTRIVDFSKEILCTNQSSAEDSDDYDGDEDSDDLLINTILGFIDNLEGSKLWETSNCFVILSPPSSFSEIPNSQDKRWFTFSFFGLIYRKATNALYYSGFTKEHAYYIQYMSSKQRFWPKESRFLTKTPLKLEAEIEWELSRCQKSVYYDSSENIKREKEYLSANYPRKNFYKSSDPLFSEVVGWTTTKHLKSKFSHHMQILSQAGILQEFQSLRDYGMKLERSIATKIMNRNISLFKPVTIYDSISTIFIIILCLDVISISAILLEISIWGYKNQLMYYEKIKRYYAAYDIKNIYSWVRGIKSIFNFRVVVVKVGAR